MLASETYIAAKSGACSLAGARPYGHDAQNWYICLFSPDRRPVHPSAQTRR